MFQYFIVVFLLFVTMLIGGVLAYVFREKLVNTLEREMSSSMRVYDSRKSVREAWDTTQSTVSDWARHHRNATKLLVDNYFDLRENFARL